MARGRMEPRRGRKARRGRTRRGRRRCISTCGISTRQRRRASAPRRKPPEAEAPTPDRRGLPSPLLIHLAAASSHYAHALSLAAGAEDPRFPWLANLRAEGRAAGRGLAQAGEEGRVAAGLEAARRLREMIAGIERYQAWPSARTLEDPPTVWSEGSSRLLDYGRTGDPVVLVTPSLVNRAYVLDLHPARSLLRWLATQGFRPLLLEWGPPGARERDFDLSAYLRERMIPAAEAAAALNGGPPAGLGYCMGGAFAAALAARRRDLCGRLALIGAPWDFSRLQGLGAAIAGLAAKEDPRTVEARLLALGEALGAVPVDLLQLVFAALDPTLALRKFRRFAALPDGSLEAELFVATEDWLNDGVAMAAPAAAEIAVGWYMRNLTAEGEWLLDGEPVVPEAVEAPTLAFCSSEDRIAPPACAEALPRAIPGARLRRPRTGHVGMIVGSRARKEVWEPLARFLAEG